MGRISAVRVSNTARALDAERPKGRYFPFGLGARQPQSAVVVAILIALASSVTALAADVYRWQDDTGKPHFTDRPSATAEKLTLRDDTRFSGNGVGIWRKVWRVYDGDTVTLEGGEKVRLLSINTPEISGSYRTGEPGGQEARAWLSGRIAGRRVRVETDVETKDRYGRTLAYLWGEDGTPLNLALVQAGLATTDIYPPNLKYVDAFIRAEKEAESQRKGLWAMPAYQAKSLNHHFDADTDGWQRLIGKPSSTSHGRNYTGLRFGSRLEVRVPKSVLHLFPSLSSYVGQTVEVRGWLSRRSRKPALWVRHPSALVKR